MKITSDQMEELYPIFKRIAYFSFRRAFSFLTEYEAKTLAHDYTVRFFYSKSLSETYDEDKSKGLKAYFESYIRKSLMSYYREVQNERKVVSFEARLVESYAFDGVKRVEFENYLDSLYSLLDKIYITVKGEVFPCRVILKAIVIQVLDKQLWGGEVSRRKLQETLGLNDEQAQRALDKVRRILNAKRAEGLI